jgi:hypothetical protein
MEVDSDQKGGSSIVTKKKDEGKALTVIKELSLLTDLATFQAHVGAKTKFGRKPHSSDPWGYTRELLAKYHDEHNLDEIIRLFGKVGATDEVQAALWVATNIRHVK